MDFFEDADQALGMDSGVSGACGHEVDCRLCGGRVEAGGDVVCAACDLECGAVGHEVLGDV